MRRTTTIALLAGVATTAFAATPALADNHEATVSVLHGVPGLTVDVYVNGEEAIPDFTAGTLTDPMMLAEGGRAAGIEHAVTVRAYRLTMG